LANVQALSYRELDKKRLFLEGSTAFQYIKLWQMVDTYKSCVEGLFTWKHPFLANNPYYVINYIKKDDWIIFINQEPGNYLSINLLFIVLE